MAQTLAGVKLLIILGIFHKRFCNSLDSLSSEEDDISANSGKTPSPKFFDFRNLSEEGFFGNGAKISHVRCNEGGFCACEEAFSVEYKIPISSEYCDTGFHMGVKEKYGLSNVTLSLPLYSNGTYPLDIATCDWTFSPLPGCTLAIQCNHFEMRQLDRKCKEEYLLITDGIGGRIRACGNHKTILNGIYKPSKNGTDLYLSLRVSANKTFDRPYRGYECVITCEELLGAEKKQRVTNLPKTARRRRIPNCTCGKKSTKTARIVKGKNAGRNEFPWIVAMVKAGTREIRCGGSVINDNYVLTAAHCIVTGNEKGYMAIDKSEIELLFNSHLLDQHLSAGWRNTSVDRPGGIRSPGWNLSKVTDNQEGSIRRQVKAIIYHPLYDGTSFDFDVAVLQLSEPVDITGPNVTPVCLPHVMEDPATLEYKDATVAGWGLAHQNAGGSTRLLQKTNVTIYPTNHCYFFGGRGDLWTDRMLCAGSMIGETDACTGDSGGPLTITKESRTGNYVEQRGIVSSGTGCAQYAKLAAYAQVSHLVQWIVAQSSDGRWCQDAEARSY